MVSKQKFGISNEIRFDLINKNFKNDVLLNFKPVKKN